METVKQLINAWQWVAVLHGELVQRPVVYTHAQLPICLADKQDGCTVWRLGRLNQATLQKIDELPLGLLQLQWTHVVDGSKRWFAARLQLNLVID